jgi:hypothetical protein
MTGKTKSKTTKPKSNKPKTTKSKSRTLKPKITKSKSRTLKPKITKAKSRTLKPKTTKSKTIKSNSIKHHDNKDTIMKQLKRIVKEEYKNKQYVIPQRTKNNNNKNKLVVTHYATTNKNASKIHHRTPEKNFRTSRINPDVKELDFRTTRHKNRYNNIDMKENRILSVSRSRSGNIFGGIHNKTLTKNVWEKGREIHGKNPDVWRKDLCGNLIKRSQHGNRNSIHGWERDHIQPKAKGGPNNLSNLQPLQWEQNVRKRDHLNFGCG